MTALIGLNPQHHNDAFKSHWSGTWSCFTHICRAQHILHQRYPFLFWHWHHPVHFREPSICCCFFGRSEHGSTALTSDLMYVTTFKTSKTFQKLPFDFAHSCFLSLYWSFPYILIFREEKNPHNGLFTDAVIFLWLNSLVFWLMPSIQQLLSVYQYFPDAVLGAQWLRTP